MTPVYVISEHELDWDDYPIGPQRVVVVTADQVFANDIRSKSWQGHHRTNSGRRAGVTVTEYELGFIDQAFLDRIGFQHG